MVTISGTATARSTSSMPLANVAIAAYRAGNDTTPVAMTTSDAQGNYSLVIMTNGNALDGYLKATIGGYLDTYLYPPAPVAEDFAGASVYMLTQGTLDLLSGLLCGSSQMSTNGVIAALVADANDAAVAGATVSSSPAASKVCYNQGGTPNKNAMMTDTDGVAYMLNVPPGNATVSAAKAGSTFQSHAVNARVGTFTTTIIQ